MTDILRVFVQDRLLSTRNVELTRAGEVLSQRLIRMREELDQPAKIVRVALDELARDIKIGSSYPETTGVMPASLAG